MLQDVTHKLDPAELSKLTLDKTDTNTFLAANAKRTVNNNYNM